MMNSYRQNKSHTKRLLALTALVVFLFLLDVLSGGAIRHRLRGGVVVMAEWSRHVGASIVGTGIFSTRASLEARNRSLSEELAQLRERAGSAEVLRAENDQLRAFVYLVESPLSDGEGVTAPVVSSARTSPYGTFLIGAGAADGVALGSFVLTSGGFVVGTVSDVGAHTATISEIFAPNASTEAIISGATLSVVGSGGGNARAKVPRALNIQVNDSVVAPQLGQRPIGIVGSIASSTASASQEIFIVLPVNLSSIQYVYILPIRN